MISFIGVSSRGESMRKCLCYKGIYQLHESLPEKRSIQSRLHNFSHFCITIDYEMQNNVYSLYGSREDYVKVATATKAF